VCKLLCLPVSAIECRKLHLQHRAALLALRIALFCSGFMRWWNHRTVKLRMFLSTVLTKSRTFPLQGLICNFLVASGKEPYNDDDGDDKYDADQKTQRGYCKSDALVVLL
jgi:hypothetical protein